MKVGVIGAGAWGTALSIVSARGGSDVVLWSYDGEYKHFDGVELPQNLQITADMSQMAEMDAWLVVTPASYFRETMRSASKFYKNQPIIICTKGAESSTGAFTSEMLHDELPTCVDFGVLSGPQFAAEVAQSVPTGSTLAGTARAIEIGSQILNKLFIEPSDDVIGAEMCGMGKNAVALICGYNSIVCRGENDRAMLFTRAWNEVVDLGLASGAKTRTFLGLCGIGDLFLSATSATSRNYAGGMAIAQGNPPQGTVEGLFALGGLISRAKKLGVPTPVLCEMRDKMGL
ncbi:MAG: hypothetical protein J6S06_01965 [Alphaproteobacteria bacterium]|nr:hypothetical protein [Alphaproteobacteria bacterium]